MLFRKSPKKPELTRAQVLNSVAVANPSVRVRRGERGVITLIVPYPAPKIPKLLARWIPAEGGERTVALDEVGTLVWEMCDSETTVARMIERLSERYKMNRKEAEVSLMAFLRSLTRKQLIAIAVLRTK